jgi:hypothetical protein
MPMVLSAIQVTLMLTIFRWEPIDFSIRAGKDESALKMIALLYDPKDPTQDRD